MGIVKNMIHDVMYLVILTSRCSSSSDPSSMRCQFFVTGGSGYNGNRDLMDVRVVELQCRNRSVDDEGT
jgi:hypothetical protein